MCVALECKPDNGCEIQTACCGESSVTMRLRVVTTAKARARENTDLEEDKLNEGTCVLNKLVISWAISN